MDETPAAFEHRCTRIGPLRAPGRAVMPTVRCIVLLAVTPCVLGAQNTRAAVDTSYARYQDAYQHYQDTLSKRNELSGRWDNLFERLDQARERGDESAMNRLRPDIQDLAEELEGAEAVFRRVEAEWREAGRSLIRLISGFQYSLSEQLLAVDEDAQANLLDEFDAMGRLRVRVEREMGPRELGLPLAPNIQALPEDTPVDRARKAASLMEYASKLQGFLEDLRDEIRRLEQDQQMEAQMRAFGRDPLGIRIVPVGAGGAGDAGAGADTTEVDLSRPTLAQEIEGLKRVEAQVEERERLAREQAEELRGRPGGTV